MTDEQRASLNPEDFIEGGGLYDDVDATITEAIFVEWDYNGKMPTSSPALKITFDIPALAEDEDDYEGTEEYWSAGSAQNWVPSKDGKSLYKVGTASQLAKDSNASIFLKYLRDAERKFGKLLAEGDISVLDGTQVHLQRFPAPERKGLAKKESKYEKTILLVSEVKAMPGEEAASGKKSTKSKGKGKKDTPKDTGDVDVAEIAQDFVIGLLAEKTEIESKKLPTEALKHFKKDPNVKAIVGLMATPDFLNDGPWEYANGMVKIGE